LANAIPQLEPFNKRWIMARMDRQSRRFYEYDPDANSFVGVGFHVGPVGDDNDDSTKVTRLHWSDTPVRASWKTLACHGFDDNPQEVGDFPSVSDKRKIPMLSERAWKILKPIIGDACEALPVLHPFRGTYYLIHVMRTIDALDASASAVDRSAIGDKRIRRIYRYAFKDDLIKGKHIFKLPLLSGSGLIVDDIFRKAVEDHGLRGLRFDELPMTGDA
jgi:hypothetical protein